MELHNIPPVWDKNSKILILGSFPSVASREAEFFYAHPQNRFWRVLSSVLCEKAPETVEDKRKLLLSNGIALWDVIQSCEISGSSDSSIKNALPNDICLILKGSKTTRIFTNGKTAHRLYERLIFPKTKIVDICLPSTSAANAAVSLNGLIEAWRVIK